MDYSVAMKTILLLLGLLLLLVFVYLVISGKISRTTALWALIVIPIVPPL